MAWAFFFLQATRHTPLSTICPLPSSIIFPMPSYPQRSYQQAAQALQDAQDAAHAGAARLGLRMLEQALDILEVLAPTRERDILLAHAHLGCFQVLGTLGKPQAEYHLRRGVSYARTTRDPEARRLAQECLEAAG